MALPKRIRRQMEAEGHTMEDVANEIETGRVVLPIGEDEDGADNESAQDPVVNESEDGGDDDVDPDLTLDDDADDDADGADKTASKDSKKKDDAKSEAEDEGDDSGAKEDPSDQYINPFDVGLEDVDPPQQKTPPAQQQQTAPAQQPQQQTQQQTPPAQQQQTPPPARQPDPNARLDPKQVLTQAEVAMLGGERQAQVFLHMVQRLAIDPVSRVQKTVEQQQATVHGERVRNFRSGIAATVPQYREVISSHAWQRYLKEYSPYTGTSVEEALIMADSRFDERAVLGIFQGFLNRYKKPKDPVEPEKGVTKRPKPADLAVPGKSAVSNPAESQGKRYKFKESYASQLDDARRRKKISSVEYQDKMAEYEKALRQGKVKLGA